MKGFGENRKSINNSRKNSRIDISQEQIINKAIQFHLNGNIQEAKKFYQKIINQGCKDHRVFCNYGVILKNLGKLQEAALSTRKAIELNPNYALAHSNFGNLLRDLGKLQEAELSFRKAIELNPDYSMAHCNLGALLKDLGKLQEAELSFRKAIELNPDVAVAHSNLGSVLKNIGQLKNAEKSTRKAIELNPDYAEAYSNLGNILKNLGEFQEAEKSTRKAIELNPDLASAYFSLSTLKYSDENQEWKKYLLSEKILKNKLKKDKVNIFFARGNIFHKEKNYKESTKYLKLANKLKLAIRPSKSDNLIDKSKALLIESDKKDFNKKAEKNYCENIFVVGMPRSGSTLVESILSMNNDVFDLGEINFLEESYNEYKNSKEDMNFAELYLKKVNSKTNFKITTNKNLYNYLYTGLIASQIPNAKIIHCFRNPLDNILSIYRANFKRGNEYSSSIVDCARIYLDQENVMKKYKNRFPSKIYDLNYDSLVTNPNQEIKSLIKWLGWEWDDSYLSPHLNTRSVSTASNIQVRSPINTKSLGGWKNYKEMLKPAMEIITKEEKYKDLKY